ncbi:MAG: PmoA family protein [Kiritimatiellae bacterium]|nr:PmoA family protein [Kiritimatiellia bacterium]
MRRIAEKIALLALAGWSAGAADSLQCAIRFEQAESALRILAGAERFAVYRFAEPPSPCVYPLVGPTGTNVLREYPFATVPGESHDHPHHRGLWLGHGEVNGHDFWSCRNGERIQQAAILERNDATGRLVTSNHWVAAGSLVAADTRAWVFRRQADGSVSVELDWRLFTPSGDIELGDTKEGLFALRVATALQCDPPGHGTLINSEGDTGSAAWGRRARWCRASGIHSGAPVSILMFDHPSNPGHPNGWHVRTYGLLAANPIARKSFRLSEQPAPQRIPAGSSLRFRWCVVVTRGVPEPAAVESRWRAWSAAAVAP